MRRSPPFLLAAIAGVALLWSVSDRFGRPADRAENAGSASAQEADRDRLQATGTPSDPALHPVLQAAARDEWERFEERFNRLELTDSEKSLSQALDSSPLSRKIFRLMVASNRARPGDGTEALVGVYQDELALDPKTSASALLSTLSLREAMAPEMIPARAALITALSRIPGHATDAKIAAFQEISHPLAPPENSARERFPFAGYPDSLLLVLTEGVALEGGTSRARLEESFEGILAETDPASRDALAEQMQASLPELESRLESNISRQNAWIARTILPAFQN